MARPIPVNQAGMARGRQFDAQAFAPVWNVVQQAAAPAIAVPPPARAPAQESWAPTGMMLITVSGMTGGLAVISGLGLWPALSGLGLGERAAFLLLVGGVYLLATTVYAAWRTKFLRDLNRAPWDARLMAYANVGVGGAVTAVLGVVALAIVALVLLLVALAALLLGGAGGQPRR